jgi:hypothetical protein
LKGWRIRFDGTLNDAGPDPAVPVEAVTAAGGWDGPTCDVSYDLRFVRDQRAYMYRDDPRWDGLFDGHVDDMLNVTPLLFGIRDELGRRATMWNDRSVFRCETADGRTGYGSAEFQFREPSDGSTAPRPLVAAARPKAGTPWR